MPDYPVTVVMWKELERQLKELASQVTSLTEVVSKQGDELRALKAGVPPPAAAPRKSMWD